jgi:16S rRNA C1402 N4-methylase RsmH
MGKIIKGATKLSKIFIDEKLSRENQCIIDATVGNGYDILYLRQHANHDCKIFGFDVQQQAIDQTKKRLIDHNALHNIELIHDSHEMFEKYIDTSVDLIVYNLGYLPGSDKSITTTKESTIKSIQSGIRMLKKDGLMVIVAYPGHAEGLEEYRSVDRQLQTMDRKVCNVLKMDYLNQKNDPPVIYIIEKK